MIPAPGARGLGYVGFSGGQGLLVGHILHYGRLLGI